MPKTAARKLNLESLECRVTPASLVSVNLAGTAPGNAASGDHNLFLASDISTDGRYVAFLSEASDITNPSGASSPARGVYVRDLTTNTTELASEAFDVFSYDMSDDGHFLAFYANTTIYIRDLVNNSTKIAVTDVGGGGLGFDIFISPNGRSIAFQDDTPATTGFVSQLFVYDSQTDQVNEVTPGTAGAGVDLVQFSDDGTKLAFNSTLTSLTPNDTNALADAFVHDITTHTTTLISVKSDGSGPSTKGGGMADISADGKRVVFFSEGVDLTAQAPPGGSPLNLYVRDLTTNTTTLLSVDAANTVSGGAGGLADLTPDGKYVIWRSFYDLLGDKSGLKSIIFRKNIDTGELVRVDQRPDGGAPNGSNTLVTNLIGSFPNLQSISDDGRYVTFLSNSTDLVTGYTPPAATNPFQVYVRDIGAGITHLASNSTSPPPPIGKISSGPSLVSMQGSVNGGGDAATNGGDFPILSGDGSRVAFYSTATNLTSPDANGKRDVFAFDVPAPPADTTGAKVSSVVFSGTATGTFDKARITFSEPINASTFDAADIGSFVEPGGGNAIPISGVTLVAGTQNQFDISFPAQTAPGKYSFTTSTNILDLAGNPMNQDGDASNGEDGEDQFTASATLTGTGAAPPFFAVGNVGGAVEIRNISTGAVISTLRPFDEVGAAQYTGLVQVAVGDFNGDAVPDVAVAAATASGQQGLPASKAGKVFIYDGVALATATVPPSKVRAFDGPALVNITVSLTPFRTFTPFATTDGPAGVNGAYINGLNIAAGDVNGDGKVDLIAGTRGGNGTVGLNEYGRVVVIDGTSPEGSNNLIGTIQKPFGSGYQKGVVVAAGNVDGVGGDEIAVTRGGPVASPNPIVQQIKVKVIQLQGGGLTELKLAADGSTAFAPFGGLAGAANAIKRDGRVTFVDTDGDGDDELVFTALDPLTDPNNKQVRVGVFSINPTAGTGAATIVSTGADSGTYVTGSAVVDHAITHVAGAGTQENLVLFTESASSGLVFLAPLTGAVQAGGFALSVINGGITIDGI